MSNAPIRNPSDGHSNGLSLTEQLNEPLLFPKDKWP